MIIFPAIDIKEGNVVRLLQGKYDQVTEYSSDPMDMAKRWKEEGAEYLHLVDLDGALAGEMKNSAIIKDIAQNIGLPVQVGGGIREADVIHDLINGGVSRVILGTKAVENKEFVAEMLDEYADKIAVSLDCKDGFIAQRGWTETSDVKVIDFARELEALGLTTMVYTDISRDGMLTGPHFEGLKALLEAVNIGLIASGGVSSIEDLKQLAELEEFGLIGAITGKAIYEGRVNLKEAIAACSTNG